MEFPKKRSEFSVWVDNKNRQVVDFRAQRSVMYPNLEEQLDALWKDMDAELVPGKGGKFYNSVAKAKKDVVKPSWYDDFMSTDFSRYDFEEDVALSDLPRDDESVKQYILEAEKFLDHEDKWIADYAVKLAKCANDLVDGKTVLATFDSFVPPLNYYKYSDAVGQLNYIREEIRLNYARPPAPPQ